jgi:hypothetical protein
MILADLHLTSLDLPIAGQFIHKLWEAANKELGDPVNK